MGDGPLISRRTGDGCSRGVTLPEYLVATTVLAIMMTFVAPIAVERVKLVKLRTVVSQLGNDLRAARWVAVSSRGFLDLTVDINGEFYEYMDTHGKLRKVQMPDGVDIVSSTSPIRFGANGSVTGGATTVLEARLSDTLTSRWTIQVNHLGVPMTTHEKVTP